MVIDNSRRFLSAIRENPNARIYVEANGNHSAPFDPNQDEILVIDSGLVDSLIFLGIIFIYADSIEVNPMAIRVLDVMYAEGKELTPDNFHLEIEASKKLYHDSHHFGPFEPENQFT